LQGFGNPHPNWAFSLKGSTNRCFWAQIELKVYSRPYRNTPKGGVQSYVWFKNPELERAKASARFRRVQNHLLRGYPKAISSKCFVKTKRLK